MFVFVLTFLITVTSYSVSLVLKPDYLKQTLSQGGLYSAVTLYASQGQSGNPGAKVDPVLLQKRVESFLDDTFAYFKGTKMEKPALDTTGLLPAEMIGQKSKLELSNAAKIKNFYQNLNRLPMLFGIVSLVLLIFIFLLGTSWGSKLRKVSGSLFVAGFWGLVLSLLVVVLGGLIAQTVGATLSGGPLDVFSDALKKTLVPVPLFVGSRMIFIFLSGIGASLVLLVISFFVKTRKEVLTHLGFTQEDFVHSLDWLQTHSKEEDREQVASIRTEAIRLRTRLFKELLHQNPPLK